MTQEITEEIFHATQREKRLLEEGDDIEGYKGKWRNQWIFKTGTFLGGNVFDCEVSAQKHIDWLLNKPQWVLVDKNNNILAMGRDYITAFPMPIKD